MLTWMQDWNRKSDNMGSADDEDEDEASEPVSKKVGYYKLLELYADWNNLGQISIQYSREWGEDQ